MTQENNETLRRFHGALVREIRNRNPDYLDGPFSVAEIYQNLVPYRTHRDEIGVEMNADYEHALLQLLAGEGDYLTIESRTARQEIREELSLPNPNTGLYRDFAAADVRLNPSLLEEVGLSNSGDAEFPVHQEEAEGAPALTDAPVSEAVEEPGPEPVDDPEPEAADTEEAAEPEAPVPSTEVELASQAIAPEVSGPEDEAGEDEAGGSVEALEDGPPSEAGEEAGTPDTCRFCMEKLPDDPRVRFCPFCGSNIQLVPCPNCGEELELNWRFCIACGTEVSS